MRRFIDAKYDKKEAIRSINNITVDFDRLKKTVEEMKRKGYIEKIVGWKHPFAKEGQLINMPEYKEMDLWAPIKMEG